MVAHILGLKLRLLRNGFKRSVGQLIGVVIGGLYVLGMIVMLALACWFTAEQNPFPGQLSILIGSVAVLGWAVVPPLLTGVDLTLEPSRFVHFGIDPKVLGPALVLAGFISVPALLTILGLLGSAGMWRLQPGVMLLALAANLATAVMAVLLCQYLTIMATALRAKRRFRELTFGLLFLLLVSLGPLLSSVISAAETMSDWIDPISAVLAYTPLGAFNALPGALAAGDFARLGICAVLGAVYLGGLYVLLVRATGAATAAPAPQQRAATARGLGFFKLLPATPVGAVAARALTYWFKDPRYAISILMVPMLPIIFWFAGNQSGSYTMMYFLGPLFGILLGFSISADVSYDNTAFALHVLTGISGAADRAGRAAACFLVGIIPLLLAAVLPAVLSDQLWRLPGDLGLSLAAFLVALGVSSVASARYTYAVALPGENPMKTPPGNGLRMALTQLGTMGTMAVLLIPVAVPFGIGLATQSATLGFLALGIGLVLGLGLLAGGIVLGGKWYEQRAPELFQAVLLNR
ncbi:transporter [Glutamicibacter uratoxydans]|uniref:Transporter n=1 Tax=Glutamicibacter uratoxydans TaxID=43667 RepID=A0A4Y4DPV3_GLUUR|nr:transporter [Glutamicibacter uratoxydans]GED05625.1 transporter [Glutamicibacter uratoxydans]